MVADTGCAGCWRVKRNNTHTCYVATYVVSTMGNEMPCIILDTTGTSYTFYETEKRKGTKKKTKTRKTNRIRKVGWYGVALPALAYCIITMYDNICSLVFSPHNVYFSVELNNRHGHWLCWMSRGRKNGSTRLGPQSRSRDNWGQTAWNLSGVSPKRDWSSKRVNVTHIVTRFSFFITTFTLQLYSSWRFHPQPCFWTMTGRGHRCRPFFPPGTCLHCYRAYGSACPLLVDFRRMLLRSSRRRAFRY